MRVLLIAVVVLAVASALPQNKYAKAWAAWKLENDKVYETQVEEIVRFDTWVENAQTVMLHNVKFDLGMVKYSLGMNKFADLTNQEYRSTYLSKWLAPNALTVGKVHEEATLGYTPPPTTQDWRTAGWVTPVKDQGQCGSCWSFSATGSLEGQHANVSGTLVSLSEQQQVSCNHWCFGCNGGNANFAFHYWLVNTPATTEEAYPYTSGAGVSGKCETAGKPVAATLTGHVDVDSGSEIGLESAVGLVGPVSVAIDASLLSFQLYTSGIYDPSGCSTTSLDHAVLAVGYNANSDGEYWIVKNSWGTSWGQAGYIWMAKNSGNVCGIATDASYPIASK